MREALKTWVEGKLPELDGIWKELPAKEKSTFLTNVMAYVLPKQKEISGSYVLTSMDERELDGIIDEIINRA